MTAGVYLLHFDSPYVHARHYIGYSDDIAARVECHRKGNGSKLMRAVAKAKIGFTIAKVWPGTDRAFERQLHDWHGAGRFCPICRQRRLRVMGWYVYPPAPGAEFGPCSKPCEHIDCQHMRDDAASLCRVCGRAIGYGHMVYFEAPHGLVHHHCLWQEQEWQTAVDKTGGDYYWWLDREWPPVSGTDHQIEEFEQVMCQMGRQFHVLAFQHTYSAMFGCTYREAFEKLTPEGKQAFLDAVCADYELNCVMSYLAEGSAIFARERQTRTRLAG